MTSLTLFDANSDAAARDAIRHDLEASLFVEAGAGTGKTRELVERIVALVTRAGLSVRELAAITFTEKAACELRDRVRSELERAARSVADRSAAAAARAALDELDDAAIGTLHAFAQRILVDHPVEVGLPPAIDILDEVTSQLAFDERWNRFYDALMDDPALEHIVLLAVGCGIKHDHLRELARIANDNWDLVAQRMSKPVADPPPVDVSPLIDAIRACVDQRDACRRDDDGLLAALAIMEFHAERLERADDDMARIALLRGEPPTFKVSRTGNKANWQLDLGAYREQIGRCRELRETLIANVTEPLLRRLASEIARFTLAAADERRREGTLEFHDLLVLARTLLRDPTHGAEVRATLARRYQRLLLDEFQDTDPIQIELAVLLASSDLAGDLAAWRWPDITPEPGRLFVVGDPKQSIYRFRRADIDMFLTARRSLGARVVELTDNFRTAAPVVSWINHVFADLITYQDGIQPEYRPLAPTRGAPPTGPAVSLIGVDPHPDAPAADEVRALEADDVVAAITTVIDDRWSVWRGGHDGAWGAARLGDVCVLLPARTSLPFLEARLDAAGIAYRAETSSLVYTTREVRELIMALRAIDDPSNAAVLVSVLRSTLYGCGDDDLFDYRVIHGGSWHIDAPRPATLPTDHPVGAALDHLRDLNRERHWLAPSELLDRIVRDRRMFEVGFATGRPRDLWRRVRFVVDQARAFTDAGGGTLRAFLRWIEQQMVEGARVVEAILPETDDDAVRIMTIHGAKGLEFPITIMSGMSTAAKGRAGGARLVFPPEGGFGVRFGSGLVTDEFERYQPLDEQMDFEERLRLLYVAATRARDHLIVSVHRADKAHPADRRNWTSAQLLWEASSDRIGWDDLPSRRTTGSRRPAPAPASDPTVPSLELDEWQSQRDDALARARVPRTWSATAVARAAESDDPGLAKEPRDLELPAWQRGRYGTAIGRAVHGVLQTIDLASGEGLESTAAAQAAAEGVTGSEARIAATVRGALASESVRSAVASGQWWRESYVATTIGGKVVEGYIDLVFRTPGGLVVVDYKTDALTGPGDVDAKLARYRLQGATYALALGTATGEHIASVRFVFCSPDSATEAEITDLADAVAEARAVVTGA